MSKRYYWLKLKENFFEEETVKLLESMENGKDYVIFLLKLRLKTINTNGHLNFKGIMPYNEKMLATITETNIDIVRQALKVFEQLALIKRLDDGTIYMEQVQTLIGSESESAERVRRHRGKLQEITEEALHGNGPVTKSNTDIDTDIDLDKDIDLEKELEKERKPPAPHQKIVELYNSICETLPKVREITEKRKNKIRIIWAEKTDLNLFNELFQKANASEFLSGRNGKWGGCSFDWLINYNNATKVLEGNYDNKKNNRQPQGWNTLREWYQEGVEKDEQAGIYGNDGFSNDCD